MVDLLFYKVVKLISLLQLGKLISIHAPHAGRDIPSISILPIQVVFQSTRPMRDATKPNDANTYVLQFQSTRPMRDATTQAYVLYQSPKISIHAPHAGRDPTSHLQCIFCAISIHAPHAGRDFCAVSTDFCTF